MSHPVCYTVRMKNIKMMNKKTELIEPIFDLDGTLIFEDRDSTKLFDFKNPAAILNLTDHDLTVLGKLVRDSGKQFDILTARGKSNAPFVRIALKKLGFNVRHIICEGNDINSPEDMDRVSAQLVAINKKKIVIDIARKLVDNDARNIEGLGELGELVTQDQTEFKTA